MTNISLHFPRSIEMPDNLEDDLFAPFGLQTTVDGQALLALRISMNTDDDTTYLQYYNLNTNQNTFCCLSYHFETYNMTDFTVVNERTILCGRFFDYALVEFTNSSFSTISQCRRLGADLSISNEESLEISDRSFALGATVSGRYLYAAIAEEEGILATGIKNFKVLRFDRRSVLNEKGVIVADSRGWDPMEIWQNGKINITPDGFIDIVSRDLCNVAVTRLRLDSDKPSDQQLNRYLMDITFADAFNTIEYAMGNSSNPTQQHCETSPQSVLLGKSTVTCHPEGVFSHQLIRRYDGVVEKQIVDKIFEPQGRLTSMCVSPCGKFMFTITILNEHDHRGFGPEFSEVWKCEMHAILDDEPSLENLARRTIVNSMGENMRNDGSFCQVLHNCPGLVRKILTSYRK